MAVLAVITQGCSTVAPSHYVSPRIIGSVVDMSNHQPIKGVRVHRVTADSSPRGGNSPGGGHLVETAVAVRTDASGKFEIKSVKTLSLPFTVGWYSVTVALERSGYQTVEKTFTLTDSTNSPSGEPTVNVGEIPLPKLGR